MISVIIPTYNRADRIESSLKSVINQSYTDMEIIVVDDGSKDHTEDVVKSIGDARIRYIRYENNRGACYARNIGISEAQGNYIAFHDSDDIWKENKLEQQLEYIINSDADIVLCKIKVNKSKGKIEYYPELNESGAVAFQTILSGGVGSTQTFFAKSEVFKNIRFDEEMPRSQDTEVLIRIAKKYKVHYMNEVLCMKYDQDDSITKNISNMVTAQERILNKFQEDFHMYPGAQAVHYNALANAKAMMGQKNICERKAAYACDHSIKNLIKLFLSLSGSDRHFIKG